MSKYILNNILVNDIKVSKKLISKFSYYNKNIAFKYNSS